MKSVLLLAAVIMGTALMPNGRAALACDIGLSIEERTFSGSIFVLSDQSVWLVEPSHRSSTKTWHPRGSTSVTACDSERTLTRVEGSVREEVTATKLYPK